MKLSDVVEEILGGEEIRFVDQHEFETRDAENVARGRGGLTNHIAEQDMSLLTQLTSAVEEERIDSSAGARARKAARRQRRKGGLTKTTSP